MAVFIVSMIIIVARLYFCFVRNSGIASPEDQATAGSAAKPAAQPAHGPAGQPGTNQNEEFKMVKMK